MLRSRLTTIARSLDNEIDPGLRHAAERIADEAKRRVPVNTGALRDAIHIEKVDDGYLVVAGDGGDVFYGHIVERGGAFTPARPFLIPAFESVRNEINTLIEQALDDIE